MRDNIEKSLKRWLKKKVKVTLALVTVFLITGNIGYGIEEKGYAVFKEEKYIELDENLHLTEFGILSRQEGSINIEDKNNENDIVIDFTKNYQGNSSSAITLKENGKVKIKANNLKLNNLSNKSSTGINLVADTSYPPKETNPELNIQLNNDINISDFENGIYIGAGSGEITANNININSNGEKNNGYGIRLNIKTFVGDELSNKKSLKLNSNNNISIKNYWTGIKIDSPYCELNLIAKENIDIGFDNYSENTTDSIGIELSKYSKVDTSEVKNILKGNNINIYNYTNGIKIDSGILDLSAMNNINIFNTMKTGDKGIYIQTDRWNYYVGNTGVNLVTNNGNIEISNFEYGIYSEKSARAEFLSSLKSEKGSINITAKKEGIFVGDTSNRQTKSTIVLDSNFNQISSTETGVHSKGINSIIDIKSNKRNQILDGNQNDISGINSIIAKNIGINSEDYSKVYLTSQLGSNQVLAGQVDSYGFGEQTAIKATTGSTVDLKSKVENRIAGTIYANGLGTKVELNSNQNDSTDNIILSSAHGLESENQNHIVSAVYAQDKSNIVIDSGENGKNTIQTNFTFSDGNDSERTIWAQQGGKVDINGQTTIIASNGKENEEIITNSRGIALTAGSGENLDKYKNLDGTLQEIELEKRSTINLNYNKESGIKGDIVSGYGGLLNVAPKNNNSSLNVQGNILAGNQGIANVNLGNGGVWYGRADDYGDANSKHETFFNPAFSNEIIDSGEVNLTMGDNSTWYVQGQSWITSINTKNSQNTMIDLVNSNTDKNETAHALTVNTLTGDTNFHMSLDGNRDVSDMLYIKNANGKYNISLDEAITEEDMFANGLSGLRFATVGAGSNVEFSVGTVEKGIFNVEYEVDTDSYEESEENHIYNGSDLTSEKPGDEAVDNFFKDEGITTLAVAGNSSLTETTNFKIVGKNKEDINDGGKTIIEMSKANYAGAVYMDNLNKRLGDMTFVDGKEGFWVRLRNDRIGEDNEYRLHNYMTQLGYDKPYPMEEGKGTEYRGIAFEISKGDMDYKNINGDANIDRQALWLYDTNVYNNGFYSDYVFRAGRMESEFDIYGRETGAKVEGNYKNLFLGASAEYGYRMNLSEKSYFEPQVQLQYTYIDGTDYTTNQDTKVELDEIHSVIGRTGFRLGHDFYNEEGRKTTTIYAKADVNHEFLGEQKVEAKDSTGSLNKKYENDGTWYDIGIGASREITPDFNVYMDVERQIGRTRDDQSWQVNLGFRYVLGE